MLKTITKEERICDFCLLEGKEVEATGTCEPSKKDVCSTHATAFLTEIRLPVELQSEMSGYKEVVDPAYKVKMVIKYTEK